MRLQRLSDTLALLQQFASEKRSSKRESLLRKVFLSIVQDATGVVGQQRVWNQTETIRTAALYSIRVGSAAEQYAACRVLEASSVLLGADQDEWVTSLERQLVQIVNTTTRAVPVRVAALRAYTMAVFLGSSDGETTQALLNLCEKVAELDFRNEITPEPLRASALDCWALLATTIDEVDLAGNSDGDNHSETATMGRGLRLLGLLKDCLDNSSLDLRFAAGQCVALIHEARLVIGIDDDDAENVTARRFRRGSWDNTPWEVLMDEVKQRIAELSTESGHHMSKKAKKEQRATFREFMATIVDDELPEETINFRGGSLTMKSWREIIQLNFIRHCLQGGFQIQILTNATLQVIFGANSSVLNDNSGLSQLEKRLYLSKTSEAAKNADLGLKGQRRKRENVKNHFLTADGEDI